MNILGRFVSNEEKTLLKVKIVLSKNVLGFLKRLTLIFLV